MDSVRKPTFNIFAVCLLAALLPTRTWAVEPSTSQVVDGVQIMLGLLPSEMVLGHPAEHSESSMHGGPVPTSGRYHVLIVLFDTKTNTVIKDAQVRATVGEVGLLGTEKKLEPMKISETLSYGNYFDMSGPGPFVIAVHVRRSAGGPTIEARFEHRHQ